MPSPFARPRSRVRRDSCASVRRQRTTGVDGSSWDQRMLERPLNVFSKPQRKLLAGILLVGLFAAFMAVRGMAVGHRDVLARRPFVDARDRQGVHVRNRRRAKRTRCPRWRRENRLPGGAVLLDEGRQDQDRALPGAVEPMGEEAGRDVLSGLRTAGGPTQPAAQPRRRAASDVGRAQRAERREGPGRAVNLGARDARPFM